MTNILVTGGAGFIGSNFVRYMVNKYSEYNIINLDALTYCGNLENLIDIEDKDNYSFVKGDIRDKEVVDELVKDCDYIINFAAESHVDNSIKDPNIFFKTNVIGCVNMLNIAKDLGLRFHQVGTDEVYGVTWPRDNCYEGSMIKPSSPYSSSKASADLIALSYFKTFGTKVTVSRCTNNLGPWQHSEKLIPTVISRAFED